jgi:hypothetical protein
MTTLVDRIPGALQIIAAFRRDSAPPPAGAAATEPKYGPRFITNTALLAIVATLLSTWFIAHVKPHVSVLIFGSVSLASLGVAAAGIFFFFVKKEDVFGSLRAPLRTARFTRVLLATLPPIAFAYATTSTVYLTAAADAPEVRLSVKEGASATPVTLTGAQKQRAVTYWFAFRPVTARIETLAPTGYKTRDLPLRRGIPTELTVPDRTSQKSFSLVRLVPLDNLIELRGKKEPDPRYILRLWFPGAHQPIERAGLTFGAIYIGASLADLQAQAKAARVMVADLRDPLMGLHVPKDEVDNIVSEWLDKTNFIPTPELKPGDQVRVELQSPAGKSELTVKVAAPINTAFLRARSKEEDE